MPSPVGHTLGAVAIGWALAGPAASRRALATQVAILAGLAVAPDLDLLIGRHSRETHSIGAALIAATAAAAFRWPIAATRGRIFLVALAVWCSHPVFDALSPDSAPPIGVMILWPLSREHWTSGLSVFLPIWRDLTDPRFLAQDAFAVIYELAIVGPITAIVWRWKTKGKRPG